MKNLIIISFLVTNHNSKKNLYIDYVRLSTW